MLAVAIRNDKTSGILRIMQQSRHRCSAKSGILQLTVIELRGYLKNRKFKIFVDCHHLLWTWNALKLGICAKPHKILSKISNFHASGEENYT